VGRLDIKLKSNLMNELVKYKSCESSKGDTGSCR